MSQYWRVSFRSGVIASVVSKKISVQSPVECVMNSIGFAPSPAWKPSQSSLARGTRAARKTTGLKYRCIEKSGGRGQGLGISYGRQGSGDREQATDPWPLTPGPYSLFPV